MHIGKRVFCFMLAFFMVLIYFEAPIFSESVGMNLEIQRSPIYDGDKSGKIDFSILIYGASEEVLNSVVIEKSLVDENGNGYTNFTDIKRTGPYESPYSALPFCMFETMSMELPFDKNYTLELKSIVDGESYVLTEDFDVRPIADIPQDIDVIGNPSMENGFMRISWEPLEDAGYYKLYFYKGKGINEFENEKHECYIEGDKTSILIDPLDFLKNAEDWSFYIVAYKGSNKRICRSGTVQFSMPSDYPVHFSDPALENVIRETLDKENGDVLIGDVRGITSLDASNSSIRDIGGIQYLSNLSTLKLSSNSIRDISVLRELINLKYLYISDNKLTNIADLGDLSKLKALDLSYNNIKEIGTVSSLKNLMLLYLNNNQIEDISALKLLSNLKYLKLSENKITDFSPVAAYYNKLGLKDFVPNTSPAVTRLVSPTPTPTNTVTPDAITPDPTNTIAPTTPTDTPTATPTVTPTPTECPTHNKPDSSSVPSQQPSNSTVNTATPTPKVTPANTPLYKFTDDNLKTLIEDTVGKPMENITRSDLEGITVLDGSGRGITSLEGIQNLSGLVSLKLSSYYSDDGIPLYNYISDLSPVGSLSRLENLIIVANQISDISPLKGLTSLINLDLGTNFIKDITPLSNLVQLKKLSLYNNGGITDITPLSNMRALEYVDLGCNAIEEINCLGNLENLETLFLDNNNIKSIQSLANLKSLKSLNLDNNKIKSVKPLINLVNLVKLDVDKNPIEDLDLLPKFLGQTPTQTPVPTPSTTGGSIFPNGKATPSPYVTPASAAKSKITPTSAQKPGVKEPERKLPSYPGYVDINEHWAFEGIVKLIEKGIIRGYPDGTISPDKEISRAEIAVILMRAVNLKPAENKGSSFADSKDIPEWASGYVQNAVDSGILEGFEDNTFRPSSLLIRRDMAVMTLRAFGYTGAKEKSLGFKDSESIPGWAKAYIVEAVELDIVKGYSDNTFRPDNHITRAEAFTIISRCLK